MTTTIEAPITEPLELTVEETENLQKYILQVGSLFSTGYRNVREMPMLAALAPELAGAVMLGLYRTDDICKVLFGPTWRRDLEGTRLIEEAAGELDVFGEALNDSLDVEDGEPSLIIPPVEDGE